MTLNQQFQAIVDEIAAMSDAPKLGDIPIPLMRESYQERYLRRGPDHEDVASVQNISIPVENHHVPARLYKPAAPVSQKHCAEKQALIIYFHGGGYVLGNIDTYDKQSRAIANRTGAYVLTVDYRLAPEHKFPAAAEDAIGAALWAFDHAGTHGYNADKIIVMGDSAGGGLAAMATIIAARQEKRVAAQVLLYPAIHWATMMDTDQGFRNYPSLVTYGKGFLLDWEYLEWFAQQYFAETAHMYQLEAGCFTDDNLVGAPPTLVVTADNDPMRDVISGYANRLSRAGVDVTFRNFTGLAHNFMGYTSVVDTAADAMEEICALCKRYM